MAAVRCPLCDGEVPFGRDPDERVECPGCGTSFLPARVFAERTRSGPRPLVGRQLGPYSIGERLGSGGMGIVYRAVHTVLGREAAVKVLAPAVAQDPDYRERFLREARLAAALEHPGIVEIFAANFEGEVLYIAMELVHGGTLADEFGGRKRPAPKEAVEIILSACAALQAAHEAGILHRDIKPENIMLTGSGKVKLTDFGLARKLRASTAITQPGVVMGTPGYISPEQLEGASLDPRSDIYSLGATFYFLLTGQPPYAGEDLRSILLRRRWEEVRPAKTIAAQVPQALSDIAAKMLAKSPSSRYQSCAELARDLETFLEGGAVAVDVPTEEVPTSELPFGIVALRQKLVTEDELLRCIRAQEKLRSRWGDAPPLGEIMVKEGLLSPEKVPLLVGLQARGKPRCENCGRRLSARDAARKASLCPTCRREMRGRVAVEVRLEGEESVVLARGACAHDELVQALRPAMAKAGGRGAGDVVLDITGVRNVVADFATEIVEWATTLREEERKFRVLCTEAGWRVFERIGLTRLVQIEKAAARGEEPAEERLAEAPRFAPAPAGRLREEATKLPGEARPTPGKVKVLGGVCAACACLVAVLYLGLGLRAAAAAAVPFFWLSSFLAVLPAPIRLTGKGVVCVISGVAVAALAGWFSSAWTVPWFLAAALMAAAGSATGLLMRSEV